jgi:hypothetical protein
MIDTSAHRISTGFEAATHPRAGHDVRVSINVEFHSARDHAAATILEGGPDGTFETLTVGNFDAITAIEEWDRILTGRTAEELERDDVPLIIAGDAPFVIAVSTALQDALIASDQHELATAALGWIEQEELDGYDPELFTGILSELAALANTARQEGHALYCWMC